MHLSAFGLWLGIWGQLLLLYRMALRGTLEATGHDKPCVWITQMLWRGGGQELGEGCRGPRGHNMSQQPNTDCHDKMLPQGTAGAQICPGISLKKHKEPVSEVFNIISKWRKTWMATVHITTGIPVKQRGTEQRAGGGEETLSVCNEPWGHARGEVIERVLWSKSVLWSETLRTVLQIQKTEIWCFGTPRNQKSRVNLKRNTAVSQLSISTFGQFKKMALGKLWHNSYKFHTLYRQLFANI